MTSPFVPIPTTPGGWLCIVLDAPLHYATWSPSGQDRAPSKHYETHSLDEVLKHLCPDIAAKAARDAWLFAWLPDPHADRLPEFTSACGFKFSSKGFTWIKTKRSLAGKSVLMSSDDVESLLRTGPGKTTRKNCETAWIGRPGSPKILSHGVREVIVSHRREHSRKPDEFYARVEQFCPAPRLDLFGRESRAGWIIYGNEATKFDIKPAEGIPGTFSPGDAAPCPKKEAA